MRIEFLTDCYGWDEGYITEVLEEDEDHYYFEDVWGRYSFIEKELLNEEFIIK